MYLDILGPEFFDAASGAIHAAIFIMWAPVGAGVLAAAFAD
jgi:hypothetical protein